MSQPPIERPWDEQKPKPESEKLAPSQRAVKWVNAHPWGTIGIIVLAVIVFSVIGSITSKSASEGSSVADYGTSSGQSAADAAACSLLGPMLDKMSGGMLLGDAMATIPNGWPNGQPSAEVRGVFNMFRSAAAAERDYIDGAGTFEEATSAFQEAVTAYNTICR